MITSGQGHQLNPVNCSAAAPWFRQFTRAGLRTLLPTPADVVHTFRVQDRPLELYCLRPASCLDAQT